MLLLCRCVITHQSSEARGRRRSRNGSNAPTPPRQELETPTEPRVVVGEAEIGAPRAHACYARTGNSHGAYARVSTQPSAGEWNMIEEVHFFLTRLNPAFIESKLRELHQSLNKKTGWGYQQQKEHTLGTSHPVPEAHRKTTIETQKQITVKFYPKLETFSANQPLKPTALLASFDHLFWLECTIVVNTT